MKTTQQLIELQRSITQGDWKQDGAGFGNIRPVKETGRNICTFTRQFSNDEWKQVNADATAIALVPELLAEVIRLRIALGNLAELPEFNTAAQSVIGRALLADAK